jgi:predicted ATPase
MSPAPRSTTPQGNGPAAADPATDAMARAVRWQVRVLGGLDADDGRQRLTRFPSRAVAALLARLAMAPERAHAREELVELLWPGVERDIGRNRLRQALSTLKSLLEPPGSALGPVLLADRSHVRVVPGALDCDAVQFERQLRAGRAEAARALYRGELLPGFYADWIDEERLRLGGLHDRLGAAVAASAATFAAMPAATPAGGPRPSATSTVPFVPGPRVLLPHHLTRLFGAEEQARRLREQVLAHRLVTLIGPGGAGKTRLATEVAHSLCAGGSLPGAEPAGLAGPPEPPEPPEPFGLIAFVALAACSTREQMLDAMAAQLQFARGQPDALGALQEALAARRGLVVLDNFEQLVDAAADVVVQMVARLPRLHLLVTSRRALGVAGEHEFAHAALALPPPGADLAAAAANPAVALFVERARDVRADFHLGPRNVHALVELVRELEGMPLAIELAASRARSLAPAEMLERLRGAGTPRLALLARSSVRGGVDPRHASMQRAIAWSWDLLPPDAARLLAGLTVFAGPFGGDAAEALATDEPVDVALRLDDLVAHSLVQVVSGEEPARFSIYQPIREFARGRIDEATARHWRERLRRWARRWVEALPKTPPLPALRAEMPNLVAALQAAVADGEDADAVQLMLRLRRALEDVELPAEGLALLATAVERCVDPALQARGRSMLGSLLFSAGRPAEALAMAEAGVRRDLLQGAALARALHGLARVRWRSQRRAEAVEPLLDEADRLLESEDDPELRASLHALRAFVCNAHHRDHERAERLHAQALALWQAGGNRHAVHSGLYNLAVVAESAGRPAQALERIEPVIAEARVLADWRRLSQSLNVRGNALTDLRRWPEALASYQECLRIAWPVMASYDLAYGLWNLPRALARLRRPAAALQLAAFAAAYWESRFGELGAADRRYIERVRRLAARQLDAGAVRTLAAQGRALTLGEAVALAAAQTPHPERPGCSDGGAPR